MLLIGSVAMGGQPPLAADSAELSEAVAIGKRMYREGLLPSGGLMSGMVAGDVRLTGTQVICGACHRRSGLGAAEGQEVAPAIIGEMLYQPLRTPTSRNPLAPMQRPAYTDATLKRAIREGIDAAGQPLDPLMPRYPLTDAELDILLTYLKSLSLDPSPGVTDHEIHFATILADGIDQETRKAFLDVFEQFIALKNTETRHEGARAANPPWHKEWIFGPYRKWVLHVWDLKGPPESWQSQLRDQYQQQPVFAVLSGMAPGPWQPIHDFCEETQLPCLFPVTDLPVVGDGDAYSVYFSRGMALQADGIVRHLRDADLGGRGIVQVYRPEDPRASVAAEQLRRQLASDGEEVEDILISAPAAPSAAFWDSLAKGKDPGALVIWLGQGDLAQLWESKASGGETRLYLSTSLTEIDPELFPLQVRERLFFVLTQELPSKQARLLARSTGWLRSKGVYSPKASAVQGDAYFTLKMVGGALIQMRGFFLRDYLLERIEHMVDSANYTSVYPHVSLAPGQRFLSRSAYIAQLPADGGKALVAVTDWRTP
ncbi:c-type cytochrome [Thiorhodococcus mannitoliphagus]|nr:c-type cytochrome [Thiorhodococcus mannitoliphagus]